MRRENSKFVFDSRADMLRELIDGADAAYLVGYECPKCHALHVINFRERMTPFSYRPGMQVPAGVHITVEHGVFGAISSKLCRTDWTAMVAIRTEVNAWLFDQRDPYPRSP